ncbi:MAG TPA: CBS domain-containing protein [Bellilinea sp.]|nr:CBS domain-containing protein [Bellilinea sp.]
MIHLVRGWMNELVVFVDPCSNVTEALGIMRRRYTNALITKKTEQSPEYGIITSLDICDKIVAQGRNPSTTSVRDIMSSPLITVHADMTIEECAQVMRQRNIHHLPVIDDSGKVIGLISASDFLIVAEHMGHGGDERALC